MSGPWPLRPLPRDCEPLVFWVQRLAAEYAMEFKTFCRKALHLSGKEIGRLHFEIPETVVVILSEGTGVSHERIEEMTLPRIMEKIDRIVKEYQRMDPAGARELKQRMIEDTYAVARCPRKRKSKPRSKAPSTTAAPAQARRGAAWNWSHMVENDDI